MRPKTTGVPRAQKSKSFQGEGGPNWILIAGGAVLSTLSIRLGYKLKQAIDTKQQENANIGSKGNGKLSDRRKSAGSSRMHSNAFSFTEDDGTCFNCLSGTGVSMDITCQPDGQLLSESDSAMPLVTIPAPEFNKENGVLWASSPDRLELPPKPFNHHSNCSDSPCVSESGSDVFSKREVIHKLRQQLKRRDDMIMEMQDQIVELQSSLNAQRGCSTHLQARLDAANRDLFDSEREVQRLRKAIADHCVGHSNDSSWCLDEMVQILHCKEKDGQLVVPIFYQVDPSHVQNQLENFISALTFKERNKEKVQAKDRKRKSDYKNKVNEWRAALTTFAKLPGWSSAHIRPESRLIDEVVQDVIKKLPFIDLKGLLEIHESIKIVESLLDISSPNVRIVGIWGMDGLGKKALATALFTQLKHRFDACCFLENVKEYSAESLLPRICYELLNDVPDRPMDTMSLRNHVKDRSQRKKVLLVLDDVDEREQLEILVGGRDWYGPGSRIIITSRRVELLENADAGYEVPGLNPAEVLQLFVELRTFGKTSNNEDHLNLLSEVNVNCDIPRAIESLGSRLLPGIIVASTSSSVRLGREQLYYLAGRELKAKYDGLDENMKSIFLDIACFFQGDDKDVAKRILDGSGVSADRGINSLIQRSLITVTDCNKLYVHDSIQKMGKEIDWLQSPIEPGWRRRLWDSQAIYHVFRTNTASRAIEGIFLDMSWDEMWVFLSPTAFKKMVNLRILKFRNRFLKHKLLFREGLQSLPDALRYLYWDGYPFESLPQEFSGKNLVELKMHYSKVEQLWNGVQRFENLKAIDLSLSEQLIQVPDLSGAPNIESVTLSYCVRLQEVPLYFSGLEKLTSLNLKGCSSLDKVSALPENVINVNLKRCVSLKSLPSNIYTLKSLRRLELAGCSKFDYSKKFLEFLDNLKHNLENLN